ncbi:MAG: hypothetical protein A2711_01550 [Burkholderiales bacterium RIFCSPHIGHO2_01_FULL_63_240]|jgi:hypothetical protein|nr:MAG: hypothetical protein A2711_01550 [Burkholderiales bacterium RIFCSPHIGHO2_01_FULL_63_240]
MEQANARDDHTASTLIDQKIADLGDWRGDVLRRVRALVRDAAPGVIEEEAFKSWIGAAVALNAAGIRKKGKQAP